MSSFSTNAMLASPHRDVLEASIPDTADAKARLVEECKTRAKNCVSTKHWMDAKLLYEKASSVVPDDAALCSNTSLCLYSMGDFVGARDAAQKAVSLDEQYVKGYWRLAQALVQLKEYKAAVQAHETALKYDASNKAIQKELTKCQALAEEQQAADERKKKEDAEAAEEEEKKSEAMAVDPPIVTKTTRPSSSSTTTTATATATSTTPMDVDDEDDAGFTKSDHVKGYKIVNGKKTSFFHNELDEKTKELIGDIAPKRLEVAPPPLAVPAGSGSAWNKAGTWEEKDVSAWAKETLTAKLMSVTYTLADSSPAPGALCQITAVPTCDGHASFATVRGKKRYIYEFALALDWKFSIEDDAASGKMSFPDFDGTCELGQGYDLTDYSVSESTSATLTPLLDRFVRNGGLREQIHECLDDWVRQFRETY